MIEMKIILNEGKSKKFGEHISTNVTMEVEVSKNKATRGEQSILKQIEDKLQVDKKYQIVDETKEQKYKDLQEEIDSFLEFLEKHKDISLD
jgi:hypothetical protein